MSSMNRNQYAPDLVSAPGETLEDLLEERGMTQSQLAERTGRPKKTINEIIKGKAAITAETALQLEKVLGVPAKFWINREQNYRESLARQQELEEFSRETDWLKNVPCKEMAKRGWIPDIRDKTLQLQAVLIFFGVASPASWDSLWGSSAPAFRQSPTLTSEPGAIAAWLRKGELEAANQRIQEFDATMFRQCLGRIRALTRDLPRNFTDIVQEECATAGVCVVIVAELSGTRVWGATWWMTPTRPLIQLSLRYKTDDHLWFTFFHEAGHILLHGRKDVFLEGEDKEIDQKEEEANKFARDFLIPEARYRVFRRKGSFSCAAVLRFAHELGIAPGIVVGRLQHDELLDRRQCTHLKENLNWVLEAAQESR
jgi:HTH-type transcriptional regulator / antitoxin HigA